MKRTKVFSQNKSIIHYAFIPFFPIFAPNNIFIKSQMGIFSKIANLFSSDDNKANEVEEEIEPVVSLPAYKAEDDHFYNGVKRVKRFQGCCYDGGVMKELLESEWTYSPSGYLTGFTSYTSKGNIFEHYRFDYNEQNNLTRIYINDKLNTEHLYDESGKNNVAEISYNEDGSICQKWEGVYDSENHLTSGTTYTYMNGQCGILSRSSNSYDSKGNLVCTKLTYDFDFTMNSTIEMQYDENGRQTAVVEYGPSGEFVRKNTFERNQHDQVVSESQLDADNGLVEKYESEYDDKGNLTKWIRSGANGETIITSSSTYKYDEKDNYTEQTNFENDAFDSAFVHEIEYYD